MLSARSVVISLSAWLALFGGAQSAMAAEEVCYRWGVNSVPALVGQYFSSAQAAGGAINSYLNNNPQTGGSGITAWRMQYSLQSCSSSPPTGGSGTRSCIFGTVRVPTGGGTCGVHLTCSSSTTNYSVFFEINPDGCPPGPCEGIAGLTSMMSGVGDSVPTTHCSGGCTYKQDGVGVVMGGKWAVNVVGTPEACDMPTDMDASPGNCISGPAGMVCASNKKKNCGKVNGEDVCLDAVPPGSCTLMAGGGAVCESTATGAPTDSEGGPAAPDANLSLGQGGGEGGEGGGTTNYNYYGSGTVSGSPGGVSGTENPGSGGSGSGDGDGDGDGDGSDGLCEESESGGDGDGGEEKENSPCYGVSTEGPELCEEGLAECFAEEAREVWSKVVNGVPILGVAQGIHQSFSSTGECPRISVEFFGESNDFMAPVCSLLSSSGGVFRLIMQICWSIMGVRILLRPDGEGG